MKMIFWSGASAMLLLGGCAKYDGGNEDAGNQATVPIPANAAPQASVPIIRNESGEVEPVQASPQSVTPAAALPQRRPTPPEATAYRALGTEPFWSVTVRQGRATLERPDRAPLTVAVTLTEDPRALRYVGEGLTLLVTPGPCSDGMSDALYADRTQLAFGEGTLKGCGGPRVDDGPEHP
jgi:uncharacterized membrane protein